MNKLTSVKLKFPLGIDNLSSETQLPDGSVRELSNLDVYRSGVVRTRPGLRLVASGRTHSLYHPRHGAFSLCWRGGYLTRILGTTTVGLVSLPDRGIVYADFNQETFWTNGISGGRVSSDGVATFWGMAVPPSPIVSATGAGGLRAGRYLVTRTAVVNGIESGASEPVSVDIAEGGGVSVSAMSGAASNIYLTPANGKADELCLAASVADGASATLGSGHRTQRLKSLWAARPLPGQAIAEYRGRLWVASGATVWFTSAQSPHWLFPEFGYFQFPATVTMLGAVETGLFVGCAAGVWFLAGADPQQMALKPVDTVGTASAAIPLQGDAFSPDGTNFGKQCAWVDASGFLCVGRADGQIVRPHRALCCMGKLNGVTLTEIRRDGLRQVIIGFSDQSVTPMVTDDVAVSTTFTNGVVLGDV